MPEPLPDPLALEATALRYAARDLPDPEAAAFEVRLGVDQSARDALAEAVRLSAAALGQAPPAPDRSFRSLIRERLAPLGVWHGGWLGRRAYRGHPLVWAGGGAAVVAAATLIGLNLADPEDETAPATAFYTPEARPEIPVESSAVAIVPPVPAPADGNLIAEVAAVTPAPDDTVLKAAEIWAELSTTENVERAHGDETRWRQRFRELQNSYPGSPGRAVGIADSHEP